MPRYFFWFLIENQCRSFYTYNVTYYIMNAMFYSSVRQAICSLVGRDIFLKVKDMIPERQLFLEQLAPKGERLGGIQ